MNDRKLASMALAAMKGSYAPYSGFHVGAALLCDDGSIYTGCNIENAAYSVTVCAERVALFKAVSDGKRNFVGLAVAGGKNYKAENFCPPCGTCRQALCEFCKSNFEILLVKDGGVIQRTTLGELLPYAFSL